MATEKETSVQSPFDIDNIHVTKKGLSYTKQRYEYLVENAYNEIKASKKSSVDPKLLQGLYGVYYSALAGLLRAGTLCTKSTSNDGLPLIKVLINAKEYACPEEALYRILGEDAPEVISPYQDTYRSFIGENTGAVIVRTEPEIAPVIVDNKNNKSGKNGKGDKSSAEINALRKELKDLKDAAAKEKSEANSKYNELNARYQKALVASQNLPIVSSEEDKQLINKFQMDIEALTTELNGLKADILTAKSNEEKAVKERDSIKKELDDKKHEEEIYRYDPNYDHYYSDELPQLINSLEFNNTDIIARVAGMAVCAIGIVVLAIFCI